jgi:hypothetical protein
MHSYKSLAVLAFAVSTASTAYSAPVQYALAFDTRDSLLLMNVDILLGRANSKPAA